MHRRFSGNRQIGEWFSLTPTEVKECILLMRLVSIQAEHFTEIETEIEDDLETELEPEIETTIEQEAEIEERFGTLMLTKSEAVELIERLLKTLNKTQIIERIWGCTRGGSKAYRQAHAEFQNLIGKNDRE